MSCSSLCSISLIVAAYSICKLIKKFNTLCFSLSLLVYRCFPKVLGGCEDSVLDFRERGTDFSPEFSV